MLRRLTLAIVTASATCLIPTLTGHGRAAALPACNAAGQVGVALPIIPAGAEQVRGIFCYSIQHGDGAFTLAYQARITGLHGASMLRVVAVLHPADRLLDLRATVYQPGFLLEAQAGCGCITPAIPHPPVGPLAGVQVTMLSGSRDAEVGITQALALQPHGQTQATVRSTAAG